MRGAAASGASSPAMTAAGDPPGDAATEPAGPGWQAPWPATPEHRRGADDQGPPPQTATGHDGTGYLDPTRHCGGSLPGQPGPGNPPGRAERAGGAVAGDAPEAAEVASADACPQPPAPAEPR